MARQYWFVLGLFLFSLWSILSSAVDLYRADSRAFSTIQASQGFLAKGQSNIGVVSPDTSLWNHVNGADNGFSKDEDGYVSTTSDRNLARTWVRQFLDNNGYIYRIHSAGNIYGNMGTGGSQPKLAAFPPNHAAWSEAPWSESATCTRRSARDLFKRACSPAKSNVEYANEHLEYVNALCPDCL
ncbi:Cholera enterotoxin subunit A [Colletotrichum viniferum]|nr:Cholera enterotoxin subunit A [Colletotrichum viniferum]